MANRKLKTTLAVAGLVGALTIGGIMAYFTDTETATNTFTVGQVDIVQEEPNWTPPTDITPNQTIKKDPQVKNIGSNDAFIFTEVKVPYKEVVVATDAGAKQTKAYTELFSYTVNTAWTEVGTPDLEKAKTDGYVTHLYAYGTNTACTKLAKETGVTPKLFETVKFANVIEGQNLENTTLEIPVTSYAIQTEDINGGKTAPADVWSVLNTQLPTNK